MSAPRSIPIPIVNRSASFWILREPSTEDTGWFTYGVRTDAGLAGYVRYEQPSAAA